MILMFPPLCFSITNRELTQISEPCSHASTKKWQGEQRKRVADLATWKITC